MNPRKCPKCHGWHVIGEPCLGITSLAALKRHLQVGVRFRCIHNFKGAVDVERVVTRVQTNGIWFRGADYGTKEGWMPWGPAKDITFRGSSVRFDHGLPDGRYVEYDLSVTAVVSTA